MSNFAHLIDAFNKLEYTVSIVDREDAILFLNNKLLDKIGISRDADILGLNLNKFTADAMNHVDPWREQIFECLSSNDEKMVSYSVGSDGPPVKIFQQRVFTEEFGYVFITVNKNLLVDGNVNSHILDIYSRRYGTYYVETTNLSGVQLTTLEEKVVTLLVSGFSLTDIANILNLSRSYISKIIGSNLCPKFSVVNESSKFLLETLVNMNFNCFISPSILSATSVSNHNIMSLGSLNPDLQLVYDLIKLNFTQQEIANHFNCSMSFVAKMISSKLLPSLNLQSSNDIRITNLIIP